MIFNDTGIEGFDVSLYQDNDATPQGINFALMKNWGADFVIIRAGQNNWVDPDFARNWAQAKAAGIPRAAYWFYDPRRDPISQAQAFCALVANDPPEGRLWIDLEFPVSWGGAYTSWTHWRTMLEETKRLSGLRVGVYTANWWWSSQAVGDQDYFSQYLLWVAQYTSNPSAVILPRPWISAIIWQDGTPAIGQEVGVESIEVDHNKFNGTAEQFALEFGAGAVVPPIGGTMQGTMLNYTVNVRNAGGNFLTPKVYLAVGDKVVGEVKSGKIYFSEIKRAGGNVQALGQLCNAVIASTDGKDTPYMILEEETVTPPPPPVATPIINTIEVVGADGITYTNGAPVVLIPKV